MPNQDRSAVTEAQTELLAQVANISMDLYNWMQGQFRAGRSIDGVKQQLRRVIGAIQPLRDAEAPIGENTTRTETEFNLNWARENPELFVQAVTAFQNKAPITEWKHFVDLSRKYVMTLIAVRRDEPFDHVTDYVMADGHLYLRETGHEM